ncbi:lamin tail domain-containing protein, partial [bacterium]|nr:lamin tail domain-containing protein [candidate division CSSED10-310 bacterium]
QPRDNNDIAIPGQPTITPTPTGPTPTPMPPTATPTGPTPTPPPMENIKINEIYINPPGTDVGCYVELYCPGGISLNGLTLVGVNGYNGSDYNTIALTGHSIPTDGYFIIAQDSSVANSDMINDMVNYQNGPDSIQLRNGAQVIDAIGYGDFGAGEVFAGEGDPAPAYFTGEHSHSRIPDGDDTNNNLNDFESGELTPGEMNVPEAGQPTSTPTGPPVPTATPTGPTPTPPPVFNIIINEIHVNPDGPDTGCYVELYYPGTHRISLDGYILLGINGFDGTVYNIIPLSGEISEGGYFVIAQDASVSNADMIDENVNFQNGPDNIQLRAGMDIIVDAVGYGTFTGTDIFAGEGDPAEYPNPTGNQSLSRLPNGQDTGDNAVDFSLGDLTPGDANTQGSEPTATPTQQPPSPTFTPTPATTTPTPCPCYDLELGTIITMGSSEIHAGDLVYCEVRICNPKETYTHVPLFAILQIYDMFFFYPSYSSFDYYMIETLDPGMHTFTILPEFVWPNAGSGSGTWYAAMTDTNVTEIFGNISIFQFTWMP